jgi:hypothetical protein
MSVEPSFDEGLRKALASILGQVVSCDYALPVPPDGKELDPNAINVVFTAGNGDMSVLFKDENPKCTEGWHLSADGKGIELCSASCNKVKQDAKAELELLFGCASETGPIQ